MKNISTRKRGETATNRHKPKNEPTIANPTPPSNLDGVSICRELQKIHGSIDRLVRSVESIAADTARTASAAEKTTRNMTTLRQDVSAIRDGRTGADARLRKDPLTPAQRRQVDEVKRRYAKLLENGYTHSRLGVAKAVMREDGFAGRAIGYTDAKALDNRVAKELKHR